MPASSKASGVHGNPKIIKGLDLREFLAAGVIPVYGGYYSFFDTQLQNQKPKSWKMLGNSEPVCTSHGHFYTSLKLRYVYKTLLTIKESRPGSVINATTVNLSDSVIKTISKKPRGAASAYGERLRRKFEDLSGAKSVDFFVVIEEAGHSLHAHLVIVHQLSDIKKIFRRLKDDTKGKSGVVLKLKYKRYSMAKPGTTEWELEELDRESGLANFETLGARSGALRYYTRAAVDGGWIDYVSKSLHRRSKLIGDHRHFYCPRYIQSLAKSHYENARAKLTRM